MGERKFKRFIFDYNFPESFQRDALSIIEALDLTDSQSLNIKDFKAAVKSAKLRQEEKFKTCLT